MDEDDALDFDLLIAPDGGGYRVRLLSSPAGEASSSFTLPFSDLEIENLVLRMGQVRSGLRRRESPQTQAAREFGQRLFETVFGSELGACWQNSAAEAGRQGKRLRLRLRLGETPELLDLPWEYLYDSVANRFVALSSHTPLVRYLELPGRIEPLPVHGPLRILALISSPNDLEALDVEHEWNNLSAALADLTAQGLVQIDRCPQAALPELQRTLRRQEYHVFHFVGHGGYDAREQDGLLLFEDGQGRSRPVSGRQLGALLHDEEQLRLAVLNACEGARTSRSDPFAGVGQSLLQQGVPAVIAMQFAITDTAASIFAHEFYAAVADGFAIDRALAEARKAMFAQGDSVEWGTPVLYMRAAEGRIFSLLERERLVTTQAAPSAAVPVAPQPVPDSAKRPGPPAVQRSPVDRRRYVGMAVLVVTLLLVAAAAGVISMLRNGAQTSAAGSTGTAPAASTGAVVSAQVASSDTAGSADAAVNAVDMAAPTATHTPTQVAAPAASLPAFRYSFDGRDANGWTGDVEDWTVVQDETGNYVYQGTAPANGYSASELPNKFTMANWRNYAVHMRVRAVNAGNSPDYAEFWLTTRAPLQDLPGCSFYNTYLDFRSKVVMLAKGGNHADCNHLPLENNGLPLMALDKWHDLVVSMRGEQLEVGVDGQRVLAASDDDVQQGYAYLTVAHGAIVQYDDVEVYRYDD